MYDIKKYHEYYEPSGKNVELRPLHYDFGNIYADRTLKYGKNLEILRPIKNKKVITNIEDAINDSVERIFLTGKTPILLYSGGLDSTLVLTALNKHNINFYVTINKYSYMEAPELVNDLINNKYPNI